MIASLWVNTDQLGETICQTRSMVEHREEPLTLELHGDYALVLFEWLSNRVTSKSFEDFDDQAEQRALWDLLADLERHLVAPFREDYDVVLAEARQRVRDPIDKVY